MDIDTRILLSGVLIEKFSKIADEIEPYDHKISEYVKRATVVLVKMKWVYKKYSDSAELLKQIEEMKSIINKLERLQNNNVADL